MCPFSSSQLWKSIIIRIQLNLCKVQLHQGHLSLINFFNLPQLSKPNQIGMEEQLQAEIRKNKNLLQSNFTLMEENEQCISALTELKKFMIPYLTEIDAEQSICPDDALSLVGSVISKIKELDNDRQLSRQDATEYKNAKSQPRKQCECEKWKNMYMNQSEQSLRLSKKIVELEQKINRTEAKHELQLKQMNSVLKQYLVLFQRVHSVDFMQTQILSKKGKQAVKENKNENSALKGSKEKEKRSSSKSKSQGKNTSKKNQKLEQQKGPLEVPTKVLQQLAQFPNFISFLQNLQRDLNDSTLENKLLREQICDNETLIRIYREKERDRVLYNKLVLE